jgi:hypothetical protein
MQLTSRLRKELAESTELYFTPGMPLFVKLKLALVF